MTEKTTAVPSYLAAPAAQTETDTFGLPRRQGQELLVSTESLGKIITELMRPVMQTFGKMLENNTAALEQLSAAQSVQNDRLEALEKQIRLQTPVTSKQVTYLNDAIRQHAREILYKRGVDDKKQSRS